VLCAGQSPTSTTPCSVFCLHYCNQEILERPWGDYHKQSYRKIRLSGILWSPWILKAICYCGITMLFLTDSLREFFVFCLILKYLNHILPSFLPPLDKYLLSTYCEGRSCPRCWSCRAGSHKVSVLPEFKFLWDLRHRHLHRVAPALCSLSPHFSEVSKPDTPSWGTLSRSSCAVSSVFETEPQHCDARRHCPGKLPFPSVPRRGSLFVRITNGFGPERVGFLI
jgi:hypothetical protein